MLNLDFLLKRIFHRIFCFFPINSNLISNGTRNDFHYFTSSYGLDWNLKFYIYRAYLHNYYPVDRSFVASFLKFFFFLSLFYSTII